MGTRQRGLNAICKCIGIISVSRTLTTASVVSTHTVVYARVTIGISM